jgi:chitinase
VTGCLGYLLPLQNKNASSNINSSTELSAAVHLPADMYAMEVDLDTNYEAYSVMGVLGVGSIIKNKMIGYLENWEKLPPLNVLSQYTHVQYAFIEASTSSCKLNPSKGDSFTRNAVKAVHSAGAKIMGSLGGASMNNFWGANKACSVDQLVSQTMALVNEYDFDGVDIDFERDGSTISTADQNFVVTLNNALREQLTGGKILSHAPQNNFMKRGGPYWEILSKSKGVDFVSVQYYNDNPSPTKDPDGSIKHYQEIVSGLFNGDASKVVYGMCITDCGDAKDNMSASAAASFTKKIAKTVGSDFGGIMNWAINQGDSDGQWSKAVRAAMSLSIPATPVTPHSSTCGKYYTVVNNDICYDIAGRIDLSVAQLLALNKGLDCNNLQTGQKICVAPSNGSQVSPVFGIFFGSNLDYAVDVPSQNQKL